MRHALALSAALLFAAPALADTPEGFVVVDSTHDVSTTVDQLKAAIAAKGLTLFSTMDHAVGAQKAGLALRPTVLVQFGNPAVGTPVMQASQLAGLALPLKMLVYEDADGAVRVAYEDPAVLAARFGAQDAATVPKMAKALPALAAEAVK